MNKNQKEIKTSAVLEKVDALDSQIRELNEFWDPTSFFVLFLGALGVEIVGDENSLQHFTPIYIRCTYDMALKLGKCDTFKIELCGNNFWRVKLECVNYAPQNDPDWMPMSIYDKKEPIADSAALWLDLMIQTSCVDAVR